MCSLIELCNTMRMPHVRFLLSSNLYLVIYAERGSLARLVKKIHTSKAQRRGTD